MAKKWDYWLIKEYIETVSECNVLSSYDDFQSEKEKGFINSKVKLVLKCKCNNSFDVSFDNFKGRKSKKPKHTCNDCSQEVIAKSRRLSFDEVKYFIESESKSGCKLISTTYKNNSEMLNIECKCGNLFKTNFICFKGDKKYEGKRKCESCSGITKWDYYKVRIFIEENGCKLLSKSYKDNKTPMLFQCRCGEKFKTSFGKFSHQNKRTCNKCSQDKRNEDMRTDGNIVFSGFIKMDFTPLFKPNEYLNGNQQLPCICNKHKEKGIQYKSWGNVSQDYGCIYCAAEERGKKKRKTHDQFVNQVKNIVGDEYKILTKYKRDDIKVLMRHNECGYVWDVTPTHFIAKTSPTRCPNCFTSNSSKGVALIKQYLNDINMSYSIEETFHECKNIKVLPFDFFINQLLLIEYDGIQHFKDSEFFGGKSNFNRGLKNDKIKNQYCIDSNIPLIRIPYWEFNNIKYILENVLVHYNLIENKNNTYDKEIVLKYLVDRNWDHDKYISEAPCNKSKSA